MTKRNTHNAGGNPEVTHTYKNITITRDREKYHIHHPGKERYATIGFKDKGTHVKLEADVPDDKHGRVTREAYISKKTGRVDEGWGLYEPEDATDKRHIHEIIRGHEKEIEIYATVLEELNKTRVNSEGLGDVFNEFHKKQEPDFYNRMKVDEIELYDIEDPKDIIEITEDDIKPDLEITKDEAEKSPIHKRNKTR